MEKKIFLFHSQNNYWFKIVNNYKKFLKENGYRVVVMDTSKKENSK